MMNWIYYQMAMYYLRKAHKTPVNDAGLWLFYTTKSLEWINKVKS